MMHGTKCACERAFPVAAGYWRWLIRCRSLTFLPDTQVCRKPSWYPVQAHPYRRPPSRSRDGAPLYPPRGQANGGSGRFATHSVMEGNRMRLLRRSQRVWVGQLGASSSRPSAFTASRTSNPNAAGRVRNTLSGASSCCSVASLAAMRNSLSDGPRGPGTVRRILVQRDGAGGWPSASRHDDLVCREPCLIPCRGPWDDATTGGPTRGTLGVPNRATDRRRAGGLCRMGQCGRVGPAPRACG